jgi:hypothetical protein
VTGLSTSNGGLFAVRARLHGRDQYFEDGVAAIVTGRAMIGIAAAAVAKKE